MNLGGKGPVAVSADARYLAGWWADAGGASGRLHVYDRQAGALVPLPPAVDAPNAVMPLLWP